MQASFIATGQIPVARPQSAAERERKGAAAAAHGDATVAAAAAAVAGGSVTSSTSPVGGGGAGEGESSGGHVNTPSESPVCAPGGATHPPPRFLRLYVNDEGRISLREVQGSLA